MVGGGVVSEFGAWPCGVCGKGVAANSLQCTSCTKWVQSGCSGVKGSECNILIHMQEVSGRDSTIVDGRRRLRGRWREVQHCFCCVGDMLSA